MVLYKPFSLDVTYYCCFSLLLGMHSIYALRIYTLVSSDNFVNIAYAKEMSASGPDGRVTRGGVGKAHIPGDRGVLHTPNVIRLDLLTRDEFSMPHFFLLSFVTSAHVDPSNLCICCPLQ
jgi:hypothetical protein